MGTKTEHGLNDLETRIELSFLYDFYGPLLKENQQKIFEEYMLEDYSLAEIAAEQGITRQGVHDTIKRCSRQLRSYEEKLGLAEKFRNQKEQISKVHTMLNQINPADCGAVEQVIHFVEELLEDA